MGSEPELIVTRSPIDFSTNYNIHVPALFFVTKKYPHISLFIWVLKVFLADFNRQEQQDKAGEGKSNG